MSGECGFETHHAGGRLFHNGRHLLCQWVTTKHTAGGVHEHYTVIWDTIKQRIIVISYSGFLPTEMEFNDENTKDEPYDFRFVKWLIKEKVKTPTKHIFTCFVIICNQRCVVLLWHSTDNVSFSFAGLSNNPRLCFLQFRAQQRLWKIHQILLCEGNFYLICGQWIDVSPFSFLVYLTNALSTLPLRRIPPLMMQKLFWGNGARNSKIPQCEGFYSLSG